MSNAHLNVVNFLAMHISGYFILVLFSLGYLHLLITRINGILELLDFACLLQYTHMKAHRLYKAPKTSLERSFLSVNPLTLMY